MSRLERLLAQHAPRLLLRLRHPEGLDRATLGLLGESLALRHFRRRGWRTVARRLATPHGELDLVLARGDCWLVCEVKTARAPLACLPRGVELPRPPERILSPRQAQRVRRAARWCAGTLERSEPRLDLALVEVLFRGRMHRLRTHSLGRGAMSRPK